MRVAVGDADAVQHPVACEEVVAARIRLDRIGADAHIAAIELEWNDAVDSEILKCELLRHRQMDAGEQRMRRLARREPPAIEGGDARDHR